MRDETDISGSHELIDDIDEAERLANIDGPNVPEAIEGTKFTGPRPVLTSAERRARRESVSNMLAAGKSDDEIVSGMEEKYGMSREQTLRLRDLIFDQWAKEDLTRTPHLKAAAKRRIYQHIEEAKAANQFTAVASLERTLAGIEGTEEVNRSSHDSTNIIIGNAIVAVLGEMSPERLKEYVDAGMQLFLERQRAELPSGEKIMVKQSKR
jgi:hypothetical protein